MALRQASVQETQGRESAGASLGGMNHPRRRRGGLAIQ